MTTSGTTTFGLVASGIIEEAFDLCGVGSEGEPISADMYARARRSLNLIVKRWGAEDHLWLRSSASVPLVAGQATYTITPDPMAVANVRRKVVASNIETPLTEWSRSQYLEMPTKFTQSIPTAFYFDAQRDNGVLYLWPTPSAATAATMTIEIDALRKIQDFNNTNDDPDLPQEWLQALTYGLAEQLALKYGVATDIRQEISARSLGYKAAINAWDTEAASLFMQPDY